MSTPRQRRRPRREGELSGQRARNRGRCDFCAGQYQLRRDGGVRVHTTGAYDRGPDSVWRARYCPGSALPPRQDRDALSLQLAATHAELGDALHRALDAVNHLRRDTEHDPRDNPGHAPGGETER